LDEVAAAVVEWNRGLYPAVRAREVAGFPGMLHGLEPLTTTALPRELLVEAGVWTAYFNNGIPYPDPVTPVGHLTRTNRWAGVVVMCVPATGTRFGAVQFELFGPLDTEFLNTVRAVSVVQDDSGWSFDANGTVQAFEETDRYRARRVRDRFTPDMLERYCAALGIRVFDPGWYGPRGVLVESDVVMGEGAVAYSFEQAQRWLGIVPGEDA
jgi:hypothetical protein